MSPIPLICYGARRQFAEKMSEGLNPTFTFTAVVTEWKTEDGESKSLFETLIKYLHPPPRGVAVGSAYTEAQQADIKAAAQKHGLKFVGVPQGYTVAKGPEATLKFCRDQLMKEFEIKE
jgi:hypothetical protein